MFLFFHGLIFCAGFFLFVIDAHIAHKDTFILHELIFYTVLDDFLTQLEAHIAHIPSSLHELKFCADLDFLLMLLNTHIVHKDISLFHELTFCVYQGFHFLVLDA